MESNQTDELRRAPEFIENNAILRQLYYDRRFRVGAILLILMVGAVGLSIPRIFVVSPPDVVPQVRVSLIGRFQSRTLAHTAAKQAADGHWDDSIWTWRSALQQNPGDVEANRGLLETLVGAADPRRKYFDFAARQSAWLLKLTSTNNADLELVVQLFHHYEADDYIIAQLSTIVDTLPPTLIAELAKAHFRYGNIAQFSELRRRLPSSLSPTNDWSLYDAAWRWGWGPLQDVSKAQEELEKATNSRLTTNLARHLQLQVAFYRSDVRAYEAVLEKLRQENGDHALDHANYWELLAMNSRRDEAMGLAKSYAGEIQNAQELLLVAREYESLGIVVEAAELLQKHRIEFAASSELWSRIGDLYITLKDWPKLRELAIDLRGDSVQSVEMPGYGWYLEGVALLNTRVAEDARRAFSKAAEMQIRPVAIAYRTAAGMAKAGYPESSSKIFARLETWFGNSDEYWFALALSGYQSGDFELFRTASQRAYRLSPKKLAIINNYAASLLLLREQPAEAIRLTVECLAINPKNSGFQINHALALILNKQVKDAESVLREINTADLLQEEKSLYHYAKFQIAYERSDYAECRNEKKEVELRHLRSEQLKWMQTALNRIGSTSSRN